MNFRVVPVSKKTEEASRDVLERGKFFVVMLGLGSCCSCLGVFCLHLDVGSCFVHGIRPENGLENLNYI